MAQRKLSNFSLDDLLGSVDVSGLQPLANTMSDALRNVGIAPPGELGNLAQTFHDQIVVPANQAVNSQNIADNILNYVQQQMTTANNRQPISKTNMIVAQGGNKALNDLQSPMDGLFSSPLFWVGILVTFSFIIWYFTRRK